MSGERKHIYQGHGKPNFVPEMRAAHYDDLDTGDQYLSTGTESVADWRLIKQKSDAQLWINEGGQYDVTEGVKLVEVEGTQPVVLNLSEEVMTSAMHRFELFAWGSGEGTAQLRLKAEAMDIHTLAVKGFNVVAGNNNDLIITRKGFSGLWVEVIIVNGMVSLFERFVISDDNSGGGSGSDDFAKITYENFWEALRFGRFGFSMGDNGHLEYEHCVAHPDAGGSFKLSGQGQPLGAEFIDYQSAGGRLYIRMPDWGVAPPPAARFKSDIHSWWGNMGSAMHVVHGGGIDCDYRIEAGGNRVKLSDKVEISVMGVWAEFFGTEIPESERTSVNWWFKLGNVEVNLDFYTYLGPESGLRMRVNAPSLPYNSGVNTGLQYPFAQDETCYLGAHVSASDVAGEYVLEIGFGNDNDWIELENIIVQEVDLILRGEDQVNYTSTSGIVQFNVNNLNAPFKVALRSLAGNIELQERQERGEEGGEEEATGLNELLLTVPSEWWPGDYPAIRAIRFMKLDEEEPVAEVDLNQIGLISGDGYLNVEWNGAPAYLVLNQSNQVHLSLDGQVPEDFHSIEIDFENLPWATVGQFTANIPGSDPMMQTETGGPTNGNTTLEIRFVYPH